MKQLLFENTKINTLNTKHSELVESSNESTDSLIFYQVPIWRLGERNANNRIYPEDLGERIVQEDKITFCYNNHPEEEYDQDFNSVKAIAKNPQIIDKNLCVDVHLVEKPFGEKLKEITKAGADIGVSSVGYGLLDDDGVVITEDYELVRYLDFVLYPSYGVYITNKNTKAESETTETTEEETSETVDETAVSIPDEELEAINKRFKKWKN